MPNTELQNATITLRVGGCDYSAKATLGIYYRASLASGYDISDIIKGEVPSMAFYIHVAAEVTGIPVDKLQDEILMPEYVPLARAIISAMLPQAEEGQDDGTKNQIIPTTNL